MSTVTSHHYAEVGTLAVCGQLADGGAHMTWDAQAFRAFEVLNAKGKAEHHVTLCPTCVAVVGEALTPVGAEA